MERSSKGTINVLMNPNSYFGNHQGRLGPYIKLMAIGLAPAFVMLVLPIKFVSFYIVLEVLWFIRVAIYILGNEPMLVSMYLQSEDDEYATSEDMIRISEIHEDGLVEYTNGEVMYIISGYFSTYQNDDMLSVDIESFLRLINNFDYDVYCTNVVDEFKLQNNLDTMRVYTDQDLMRERIQFYMLQDDFCSRSSKLYKINIVVKSYKYNWKKLKQAVDNAMSSDYVALFKHVERLSDVDDVNDVISRTLGTNVNLYKMLINKYKNQNYYGSRVLFYGDTIPDKFKPEEEDIGFENMRVVEDMDNQ